MSCMKLFHPFYPHIKKWVLNEGSTVLDREFTTTKLIEMLLGVSEFFEILENESRPIPLWRLKHIATKLGWIVAGNWDPKAQQSIICNLSIHCNMEQYGAFLGSWGVTTTEELQTDEYRAIEEHFIHMHHRTSDGCFIIQLPFRNNIHSLKSCRQIALQKFPITERCGVWLKYQQFMAQCIRFSHRKHAESPCNIVYFIPHFSVRTTRKFGIVFNALTKEEGGISLNEALMVGLRLQPDIFSILLHYVCFNFYLLQTL